MRNTLVRLFPIPLLMAASLASGGCCFFYSGLRPPITSTGTQIVYKTHSSIDPSWNSPLQSGAFSWNQAAGFSFNFGYGGGTTAQGFVKDGTYSIFMTNLGAPQIYAMAPWTGRSLCTVLESDMGWNSLREVWSPPYAITAPGAGDVQSIATHEFGHWLVLLHVFWPRNAMMFPSLPANTLKRSLHACDILGINCIYTLRRCRLCQPVLCPGMMASTADSVTVLRQFKTNVMPTTVKGQEYLALFAEHASEASQVLLADSVLTGNGTNLVTNFAPYLSAYMQGGSLQYVVFDSTMYQQIASFISPLQVKVSSSFAADLGNFRSELQARVGMTFKDLIDSLLQVPPPAPEPPPPPPDPGPGPQMDIAVASDYAEEVTLILQGDPTTAQQLDDFLGPRVSYVQDYINGGQAAAGAYFTQADYNQLYQSGQAIRANASTSLQTQIDQTLGYFSSRIGFTYKAIFDEAFPP